MNEILNQKLPDYNYLLTNTTIKKLTCQFGKTRNVKQLTVHVQG